MIESWTARDEFAARAMQALIQVTTISYIHDGKQQVSMPECQWLKQQVYNIADVMVSGRNENETTP